MSSAILFRIFDALEIVIGWAMALCVVAFVGFVVGNVLGMMIG